MITKNMTDQAFADDGSYGLTKLEYVAAMALQGLLSSGYQCGNTNEAAVKYAKDLLTEVDKQMQAELNAELNEQEGVAE